VTSLLQLIADLLYKNERLRQANRQRYDLSQRSLSL
jgi:hypothetical protein